MFIVLMTQIWALWQKMARTQGRMKIKPLIALMAAEGAEANNVKL
jgi:hypothetical protein